MASNDLKARVLYPCILCLEDHPVISRMDWRHIRKAYFLLEMAHERSGQGPERP